MYLQENTLHIYPQKYIYLFDEDTASFKDINRSKYLNIPATHTPVRVKP